MDSNQLLVVDDERPFAELVARIAGDAGFDVRITEDPADFLVILDRWRPSLVIVDLQMPGMDGIQLVRRMGELGATCRVVLASGFDARTLETARRLATEYGLTVVGTVQKPIRAAELRGMLLALSTAGADPEVGVQQLTEAIENDDLTVAYQPVIAIRSRALVGVEALARWSPRAGLAIPPDRFIRLAEENGLILGLTNRILAKAIAQAVLWQRTGSAVQVAVNLSPACLDDLDFPDALADRCESAGLPPKLLRLELTETAAMQNAARMMDILTRIRLKGFDLSLDDFGVGYSSLRQLHRLPFTEIKIDRSFITDLATSRDSTVITKTIIDMAHNLGLTVVAEGIEDSATLRQLDEYGCDHGQGYLISRPVPAEQIDPTARWVDL